MNTFLPYSDFSKSAQCLDMKRLGKQRVETLQLLQVLNGITKSWINHPCTKMWRGFENALVYYGIAICDEWLERGYKDTCLEKISKFFNVDKPLIFPKWLGDENFHISHQSNLIRKKEDHYKKYFPDVPNNLEYVWPRILESNI